MELEIRKHYSVGDNCVDRLLHKWREIIYPNLKMMGLLDDLRTSKNVNLFIFSNMGPEHLFYLRKKHSSMFKDIYQHISCEIGARKPNRLFFQSFMVDYYNSAPNRILFEQTYTPLQQDGYNDGYEPNYFDDRFLYIDDLEDNLTTGKDYHFSTYQFSLEEFSRYSDEDQIMEIEKIKNAILG
jgi:FMN phosphatase YigB (HAD superfamily)